MPTTYTHYKFALEVKERLPKEIRSLIDAHPDLYFLGAMGPDLLFYTLPVMYTFDIACDTHKQSGEQWFTHMGDIIKADQMDPRELVYAYGFMAHYAADRVCHELINKYVEDGPDSHYAIEAEWDRYYLEIDGFNPFTKKLTNHIRISKENAELVAKFYPGLNQKWVLANMVGSHLMLDGLLMSSKPKRVVFNGLTQLVGKVNEQMGNQMYDMAMRETPIPSCLPKVDELDEALFGTALGDALDFITSYTAQLNGTKGFDHRYQVNFDGETV